MTGYVVNDDIFKMIAIDCAPLALMNNGSHYSHALTGIAYLIAHPWCCSLKPWRSIV